MQIRQLESARLVNSMKRWRKFCGEPCIKLIVSILRKRSANDSASEFASFTLCNEDELKEESVNTTS